MGKEVKAERESICCSTQDIDYNAIRSNRKYLKYVFVLPSNLTCRKPVLTVIKIRQLKHDDEQSDTTQEIKLECFGRCTALEVL